MYLWPQFISIFFAIHPIYKNNLNMCKYNAYVKMKMQTSLRSSCSLTSFL